MKYKTLEQERYLDKVLELRRQGYSYNKITSIFPIGHDTVRKWCVKFAPELLGNIAMKKKLETTNTSPQKDRTSINSDLEQRILELECALKGERIRADFYEEMINVAEAKFNINIRKKAGTKP